MEQYKMKPQLILGLGELLWDLLPEEQRGNGFSADGSSSIGVLGPAPPANFAVMAGRLGDHAAILSRNRARRTGVQSGGRARFRFRLTPSLLASGPGP